MGILSDHKLTFIIDADGTTAKQALKGLAADFNGLGGKFTGAFGGAIPIVNSAATAIAGVGVAAAAVGATLFQITKTAAEFGSTIYDASQKTGLGAEAISSLKAAADQSGSSLEAVTKGIAKFAKQYEGTSSDIEAELGKVFKQIAAAKPGFEQLTLAQQKFGKSGADLIPMINSFDGDLEGLIKRMSELGITIDDEAAAAADQFGDQMDVLGAQMAGVGRTIGTALMPQFTSMAGAISNWLVQNKDNISTFATVTANAFSTFVRGLESVTSWVNRNQETLGLIFNLTTGGAWGLAMSGIKSEYNRLSTPGFGGSGEASGSSVRLGGSYDPDGGKGTGKAAKDFFKPSRQAQAIIDAANKLGISPLDLATIIGFETAGTYSPRIKNAGGYTGLIQFGAAEQKQYGVTPGQSFESQVTTSVVNFLRDRFASVGRSTAGASLLDLYRTVLGGNPNASLTKTDANGTSPLSGVQKMLRDHRPEALARFFGGKESNAKGGDWGGQFSGFESAAGKDAAAAKKAEDDFLDHAEQVLQDWIAAEKLASNERLDIRSEENNLAEEMLRSQLEQGLITETEYVDRIATLKINALEDERDEIAEQIASRENNHRLQVLDLKIATEKLKKENDIADAVERQREAIADIVNNLKKVNQRPGTMKKREAKEGIGSIIFGDMDEATGKIRSFQDIIQGLGQTASDVFMQMGQGLGAMLQSWVLLGDQADVSMSKMVASVLAGVAAQAATLAIFHLAMGIVALTPWGAAMYGSPTNHFIAAAIWGGIAAGAAIGGRALAGNKFQSGGGKGSSSSSGSSNRSSSEDLTPYSRASESAYYSGTRTDSIRRLAESVDRLERNISSAKPGDVFMRGMKANRGAVGNQVATDIAGNAAVGVKIARNIGMR